MNTALNDFVKKPWKVKEESEPQTKFRNKRGMAGVHPGHDEGTRKPQAKMNPFKAARQQNPKHE